MKPKQTWRKAFNNLPPAPCNPLAIIDKAVADKRGMKYALNQELWLKCPNHKTCPVFVLDIKENGTYDIGSLAGIGIAYGVPESDLCETQEEAIK